MNENPCTACQVSQEIKSRCCVSDQLHNAFEILKLTFMDEINEALGFDKLGCEYEPKFNCFYKQLMELEAANDGD